MTAYDFEQLFAEAIVRIGFDPVARYLLTAARHVGWPIPRKHRHQVIAGLALLVRSKETRH